MNKGATISVCGQYRYDLIRTWGVDPRNYCTFIGLNPSTADAENDDPTIRRCVAYAKSWGYDSLSMVNLFAFRATDPKVMAKAADPIGPQNDSYLRDICRHSKIVIAAWGNHGSLLGRSKQVRDDMKGSLHVLRLTKSGEPSHPLYLPKDLQPFRWNP